MRRTILAGLLTLLTLHAVAVAQTTAPASRPATQATEAEPLPGVIRVACVGDSITYGQGIRNRAANSYPARLNVLLGNGFAVRNYGVNGTTALASGDRPYVKRPAFKAAVAFKPDVVVVALGTNDSKPLNWAKADAFVADYEAIIAAFKQAKPGVKVYVVLPPPCFVQGEASIRDAVLEKETVPKVKQIAADAGATVIDVRTVLSGKRELFPDLIHPNEAGAALYADTVAGALSTK